MKKTLTVNLNRQVFYLDTDAYDQLENYLESIKKYFQEQESLDVVDDIEARIAEKFTEITGNSKKVVQIEDVSKIITEMGSVNDITGETEINSTDEIKTEKVKKKLFRDPETKILTGVAAGYGWYFGIKSLYIRILFLILFFNPSTSWLAIVAYIASWLIIPEAKNNWEKLEMKGKPATVSQLQTAFEEKTSKIVSSIETKSRNILQKIISSVLKLFKFFFKLGCRLVGFFTFISIVLTIVAIVVGMVLVYFQPNLPYFDLSFFRSIGSPWLEVGYVALAVTILMPLIFILDLADNLMTLKWRTSVQKVLVMLVTWMFSLIIACSVAKVTYPKYQTQLNSFVQHLRYINYIDEANSQVITVTNIKQIDISSVKEVKITQANVDEVKIIGNQTQIDELTKNFSDGLLTIQGKNEKWFGCHDCTGRVSSVRVEIKTKNISSIKLNNTDAWIYSTSGNSNLTLGQMVGVKIEGTLNQLTLKSDSHSVINLMDATINQVDAQLFQSVLKTAAKKIKIIGDSNSTLIYKNTSQIISGENDKTNQQKYILSEDREKLTKTIEETIISLDGVKNKIKDFNWSTDFETQNDSGFYNLYTFVKPQNTTDVYVLWLVEKNGVITLKNSFKITNWEEVHYLNLVNDKFLRINGQVYGPELKEETKEIYIDKIKNTLQIKPILEENF